MCCFCSYILHNIPSIIGVAAIIVALWDSHKSGKAAQKQIDEIKDLCQLQMKSNRDAIELEIAHLNVEIAKAEAQIKVVDKKIERHPQGVGMLHDDPAVLRSQKSALEDYKKECSVQKDSLTLKLTQKHGN